MQLSLLQTALIMCKFGNSTDCHSTGFITVRHYASAVLAIVVCLSVCHTPVLYQNN